MTKVPSDIAIAQAATLRPIADVAAEAGLGPDEFLPYGRYKAKITADAVAARSPTGRLVLVTGINPTPAGEGKSTVTVGLVRPVGELHGNTRSQPWMSGATAVRLRATAVALAGAPGVTPLTCSERTSPGWRREPMVRVS